MKCVDVISKLSAYADGELRGGDAARLKAHLECCESCRKRLEAMTLLQSRLGKTLQAPIDAPDFSDQVMVLLPERSRPCYLKLAWAGAAAICMAVLVAVILSLCAVQPRDDGRTAQPPNKIIAREPEKPLHAEPKQAIEREKPQVSPAMVQSVKSSAHSGEKPYRPHRRLTPDRAPVIDHTTDHTVDNSHDIAVRPDTELEDDALDTASVVEVCVERQVSATDKGTAQMEMTTSAVIRGVTVRQLKHTIYYLPPNPEAQDTTRPALQTVETVVRSS